MNKEYPEVINNIAASDLNVPCVLFSIGEIFCRLDFEVPEGVLAGDEVTVAKIPVGSTIIGIENVANHEDVIFSVEVE